jgi:CubicO group peptidase (beta-lactamase class C family)
VISEVSGLRYERYVREEILVPLAINHTGFAYPEHAADGAATAY